MPYDLRDATNFDADLDWLATGEPFDGEPPRTFLKFPGESRAAFAHHVAGFLPGDERADTPSRALTPDSAAAELSSRPSRVRTSPERSGRQ